PVWIDALRVAPDVTRRRVVLEGEVGNSTGAAHDAELSFTVRRAGGGGREERARIRLRVDGESVRFAVDIPMRGDLALWDEFNPALYEAEAGLSASAGRYADQRVERFGMRQMTTDGK